MKLDTLNPIHWNKSVLLVFFFSSLMIWFCFIDTYSVYTRVKLNKQKQEFIERNRDLRIKTDELEVKLALLKEDKTLLEKIAREKYGMRKPGEKIYKIEVK